MFGVGPSRFLSMSNPARNPQFSDAQTDPRRLGRSSWRSWLLSLVQSRTQAILPHYVELANSKPRDRSITYCSGSGGEPYTTLVTLLAYSIALHEPRLPTLRIGYDGDIPSHLSELGFVELFPVRYDEHRWPQPRALKFWNFVGKPQAMLGAATGLAVWLDSDIFLLQSLRPLFTGNAFVPMGDKVGGGIYCLDSDARESFYSEVSDARIEWQIRSDRPCMKRAIDRLDLSFDPLPTSDTNFLKRLGPGRRRQDTTDASRYWMHFSRGKARNPLYTAVWLEQVRRLLYPARAA
jgi:hypothetical protein